jgi:hypothetical protein
MPATTDEEIAALRAAVLALEPLDRETRARILRYLVDRFSALDPLAAENR